MAGERVNTYAQDDSDILALQLTTDKTFKSYHQLALTEYDTTTVPAIAAGSVIECNGALYKFDSEEAISTTDPVTSSTVADGTVYVCIVPGTTTATAAFTATAPTWSDSKQGWYGTGGSANYRYVEYVMTKSGSNYIAKTIMLKNFGDTFYYSSDATERTLTTSARTDETNLSLTVPIKQNMFYEIYFVFESIRVGTYAYTIYSKPTSDTYMEYVCSDVANQITSYDTLIANNNTSYQKYIVKYLLHSTYTGSYVHKMSWSQTSSPGDVRVRNRKFFIREISGVFL